jgi:hypothetical protein
MAIREKRSISLTPELAAAVDAEAAQEGLSVSAWIAKTIQQRLITQRGLRAMREYERENGAFTDEERAEARATLRRLLGDEAAD